MIYRRYRISAIGNERTRLENKHPRIRGGGGPTSPALFRQAFPNLVQVFEKLVRDSENLACRYGFQLKKKRPRQPLSMGCVHKKGVVHDSPAPESLRPSTSVICS